MVPKSQAQGLSWRSVSLQKIQRLKGKLIGHLKTAHVAGQLHLAAGVK